MLGASDEQHLEFAQTEARVIFTQDDDFLRVAAQGRSHAGIVHAGLEISIGEAIEALMLIYHVLTADEMANHIEFV